MYYLENIRLGNIRRFAADVNIPVSRGATIVLAPNGTGKTSLFEAIEICLSGQVNRLASSPDALVRDNQTAAFAEMHFTENILCRSSVVRGRGTSLIGDHDRDRLFPNIDRQNLPYLLRLTHLLPQRGVDWFVQSGTEEAGSLLEKLPIGKDAIRASKNMTKVKRAFSQMVSEAQKALDEIEKEVFSWNSLLERQRSTRQLLEENLIPKVEIVQRLNAIISRLNSIVPAYTEDIATLRTKSAEIIQHLETAAGTDGRRLETFASLEKTPSEHIDLMARLATTEDSWKTKNDDLAKAKIKLSEILEILLRETTGLNTAKNALISVRQQTEVTRDLQQAEEAFAKAEANLETFRLSLVQLQATHLMEQDRQQAELQVREMNQQLAVEAEALLGEARKIGDNKSSLQRWKALELELGLLRVEEDRLSTMLPVLKLKLTELEAELIGKQAVYTQATIRHEALILASDTIKNAVATIVQQLAADSTVCPVCLAEYEPTELRTRMEAALRGIQPGLDEADKTLSAAKLALEQVTETRDATKTEIDKIDNAIAQSSLEIASLEKVIAVVRAKFTGIPSSEEAERLIEKTDADIKKAIQSNEEGRARTKLPMSVADWALLQESLARIAGQIVEGEAKIRDTDFNAVQLSQRIAELNQRQAELAPTGEAHGVEYWEAAIRSFELSIQTATGEVTVSQQEVDKIQDAANSLYRQLSEIKSELDRLKGRWKAAGLTDEPDVILLELARKETTESIAKGEADRTAVQGLQKELAKWVVADELRNIDQEIDRVKGETTASDYSERLTSRLNGKRSELDAIMERSSALEQFHQKLKAQLDRLQQYLVAVNDPWKELLNRIVLDPRFAATTLTAYVRHNKQHAEVTVPLHGAEVAANFVASEAQITDLQLTFLLAMAINNPWAAWRSLLLDDPTQHHDLVHASSVFDLLRDYIVDHDFQVVLATHDSVHANFFHRKLLNDGIPVNFLELRATEAGVIVEQRRV